MKIFNINDEKTKTELVVKIIDSKNVDISIPGSNGLPDVLTALGVRNFTDTKRRSIKVSYSLYTAAVSVVGTIAGLLDDFTDKPNIRLSGHSLGGGLVQVIAFLLLDLGYDNLSMVLTGSIRAGNKEFAIFLEDSCKKIIWQEYGNDPIPLIWPWRSRVGFVATLKERKFPWLDFNLTGGDHMNYWK